MQRKKGQGYNIHKERKYIYWSLLLIYVHQFLQQKISLEMKFTTQIVVVVKKAINSYLVLLWLVNVFETVKIKNNMVLYSNIYHYITQFSLHFIYVAIDKTKVCNLKWREMTNIDLLGQTTDM